MNIRVCLLFLAAFIFSSQTIAKPLRVLTTLKPLALIVNELVDGVAENNILLDKMSSPHDYALRPSDIKKIQQADLIIWIGPQLESFMVSVLKDRHKGVVTLLNTSRIHSVDFFEHHYAKKQNNTSDMRQDHTGVDPHIWLGIEQARDIAVYVTASLIKSDSEHSVDYQKNLNRFLTQLERKNQQIRSELAPVSQQGYFVFHDAYGYFEDSFAMNHLGHLMLDPSRQPGAKTLAKIRADIKAKKAQCVFREPQFESAFIKMLLDGTDVEEGTLDPLATDVEIKSGAYFVFLQELADEMSRCLAH